MLTKLCLLTCLFAQATPSPHELTFDVSSVKPSNGTKMNAGIKRLEAGELSVVSMTLVDLIEFFYYVRPFQILGGPDWARQDRFDVTGKDSSMASQPRPTGAAWTAALNAGNEQMKLILADRFSLVVHSETRTLPTLTLQVRDGKAFAPVPCATSYRLQHGWVNGAIHISSLTALLKVEYGIPVTDETGLKDCYQLETHWTSDPADASLPELATALHDLGFTLKKSKGPVEVIVIDKAALPKAD